MIISRTPYRVSLFGGGTDYPSWYRQHGGAVLAGTINKYCYLTCRYLPPFFEHRYRVVYSTIEDCLTIDDIKHPAVREVLRYMSITRGVEVHHDGDLPARSGMGSSSAFSVGLLHALYALQGKVRSKHELAMESIHIEQERLQEVVGSQDQVAAAYGGLNHILFTPNGAISVRPVTLSKERLAELNGHLMLFFTGVRRTASDVARSYVEEIDERKRQLRVIQTMVDEAMSILAGDAPITDLGGLLDEAWQLKRSLSSKVSNSDIDDLYAHALSLGALGGKLTGAGGGGFLLLFAPPSVQGIIRQEFSRLIHVPFEFEYSGSQIIFFDREQEYLAEDEAALVRLGTRIGIDEKRGAS